jgi:predicted cupin superfamily sugar epimerase
MYKNSAFPKLKPCTIPAPFLHTFLHSIKSNQIFHEYSTDKVQILFPSADRKSRVITMGTNILDSEELQVTVPKEIWQGATLKQGGKFALLGCSVSPGFEFDDYQHGSRDQLIAQYPDAAEMITRLT